MLAGGWAASDLRRFAQFLPIISFSSDYLPSLKRFKAKLARSAQEMTNV